MFCCACFLPACISADEDPPTTALLSHSGFQVKTQTAGPRAFCGEEIATAGLVCGQGWRGKRLSLQMEFKKYMTKQTGASGRRLLCLRPARMFSRDRFTPTPTRNSCIIHKHVNSWTFYGIVFFSRVFKLMFRHGLTG